MKNLTEVRTAAGPRGWRPATCRTFALAAALTAAGLALAQTAPLPDAAVGALRDGRQAMQEALTTYGAQYPDKPLWQEAFADGRRAVEAAPGRPEPLGFLAEAYSRANWYGPAWRTWQTYLEAGGELTDVQAPLFAHDGNLMGYQAYQAGDLKTAADIYQTVADHLPANVEANRWSARIAMERHKPEDAIPYWQAVLDASPGDGAAQYFLQLARDEASYGVRAVQAFRDGVQAYEKGDRGKAANAFKRATEANDQYPDAWAWLGRVAFDSEHYGAAHDAYARAVALAPSNATYAYFAKESARRASGASTGGGPNGGGRDGASGHATGSGSPSAPGGSTSNAP